MSIDIDTLTLESLILDQNFDSEYITIQYFTFIVYQNALPLWHWLLLI